MMMTLVLAPPIRRIDAVRVALCSAFPTQLAIGQTLIALGIPSQTSTGAPTLRFVTWLSLIDAVLLVALICVFIRSHNERIRDVLLGSRNIGREAVLGLPLIIGALTLAVLIIGIVRMVAPSLHNLERNRSGLIQTRAMRGGLPSSSSS